MDRVSHVVRLGMYVAAPHEFTEHPKVADAASELLRDVFGDKTTCSVDGVPPVITFDNDALPHSVGDALRIGGALWSTAWHQRTNVIT